MGKVERTIGNWKWQLPIYQVSTVGLLGKYLPLWDLKGALVRNHVEGLLTGNNGLKEKIILKAAGL